VGSVVNNSNAKRELQALVELHQKSNQREQSRHSDWNPDRGSGNKIPGGWQSAGDERADGDEYVCDFDSLAGLEKFDS